MGEAFEAWATVYQSEKGSHEGRNSRLMEGGQDFSGDPPTCRVGPELALRSALLLFLAPIRQHGISEGVL